MMIVFRCPQSGHEVMSRILTDANVMNIKKNEFVMKCPECGQTHQWSVAEGQVPSIDEPRLPQVARIH
jgi:transcription elongation factor Elf1